MFTYVYLRLPMLTRVYLCLALFIHDCLPMFTHHLPMFNYVH